jgi:HTH-type transcriptional regulator, sugar sensing transcriptional regulator
VEEQDVISRIEELGLSNKEARVYVACLRIGPASVQTIADKAGIKRVTAYVILESLQSLGLARQSTRAKKTFFSAEDPLNLELILRRRAAEVSQQMQGLQLVLPQLLSLNSVPKDLPEIRTFEGQDSVRNAIVDFFTTIHAEKQPILVSCNIERLTEFLSDLPRNTLTGKMLYTSTEPLKRDSALGWGLETRFIRGNSYILSADIALNADRILMMDMEDGRPTAVLIRNDAFARTLRVWFELAWRQSEH